MPGESSYPIHYVCTHQEAKELIDSHGTFFVSNCGCRERMGGCKQSRIDVCLIFNENFRGSGTNCRPLTKEDAYQILNEANEKHLVTQPFRDETDQNKIAGICFCCQCCCAYFIHPGEVCDQGNRTEFTDRDSCTNCGLCIESCYFKARSMVEGKLEVFQDQCYGCGLCVDVCPIGMIKMKAKQR
ncbi:MAG TPA: 4Fe-4S dicluster-binding protein [Bacillota bacterium]|nr:4Fe-4S dicluster-binding protein [Bacillota bacterium]